MIRTWELAVIASLGLSACAADLDELKVQREEVFDFAQKPQLKRDSDRVEIAFESKGWCDATVAIEDADGKIVRHLASGVLGPKAPEPFQRNSKKQTVVWDGKDDQGRYVDDKERLTVRVALGLKPRFEKVLLGEPKRRMSFHPPLLVAAEEGVFAYEGKGADRVTLYSHAGEYLRTVYPFPADKLENVQGLEWQALPPEGRKFPSKHGFSLATLLTSGLNSNPSKSFRNGQAASCMAIQGPRIALAFESLNRLATDGSSGGLPLKGPRTGVTIKVGSGYGSEDVVIGPSSAAMSPDGKLLYLTGYLWKQGFYPGALHGVLVVPFEGGGEARVFAGKMEQGAFGSAPGQFRVPTDVACDREGRVYVADYMNDRVQVFSPAGEFLKALPTAKPARIAIRPRSQELWVFAYNENGVSGDVFRSVGMEKLNVKPTLTRYGPLDKPAKLLEQDLPLPAAAGGFFMAGHNYQIALDDWAERPALWMVGRKQEFSKVDYTYWSTASAVKGLADDWADGGIHILAEQGGKWSVIRDFGQEALDKVKRARPPDLGQRMHVNPKNEKLYVLEQKDPWKSSPFLFEVDPESGKVEVVKLPFDPEDFCFDLNGLIYLRTDREIVRYEFSSWREVPFDYGEERETVAFCGSSCGAQAARAISVLPTPGPRPVCFHQGGLWVSPKGALAVSCVSRDKPRDREADWKVAVETGKPYVPKAFPGRVRWQEVHVWDKHGKLLYEDAVPGLHILDGIALDQHDHLYVMAAANRLQNGKPFFHDKTETLIKFKPGTGQVAGTGGALIPLPKEAQLLRAPDLHSGFLGNAWAENAEWFFGGVGYGGWAPDGPNVCGCWHARFGFDYFARSFVPEPDRYDLAVLDSNGNLILRAGQYGNADSSGPQSRNPLGGDEIGLSHATFVATHSDRRVFISDIGNARIVSAKLEYHTLETMALKDALKKGSGAAATEKVENLR